MFFLQGPSVPFCSNAFQPFDCLENLHARFEGLSGLPPPKGNTGFYVPRRLAYCRGVQGTLPARHGHSDSGDSVFGLGHESTEVQPRSSTFN